jgi:hypothetical protein
MKEKLIKHLTAFLEALKKFDRLCNGTDFIKEDLR